MKEYSLKLDYPASSVKEHFYAANWKYVQLLEQVNPAKKILWLSRLRQTNTSFYKLFFITRLFETVVKDCCIAYRDPFNAVIVSTNHFVSPE